MRPPSTENIHGTSHHVTAVDDANLLSFREHANVNPTTCGHPLVGTPSAALTSETELSHSSIQSDPPTLLNYVTTQQNHRSAEKRTRRNRNSTTASNPSVELDTSTVSSNQRSSIDGRPCVKKLSPHPPLTDNNTESPPHRVSAPTNTPAPPMADVDPRRDPSQDGSPVTAVPTQPSIAPEGLARTTRFPRRRPGRKTLLMTPVEFSTSLPPANGSVPQPPRCTPGARVPSVTLTSHEMNEGSARLLVQRLDMDALKSPLAHPPEGQLHGAAHGKSSPPEASASHDLKRPPQPPAPSLLSRPNPPPGAGSTDCSTSATLPMVVSTSSSSGNTSDHLPGETATPILGGERLQQMLPFASPSKKTAVVTTPMQQLTPLVTPKSQTNWRRPSHTTASIGVGIPQKVSSGALSSQSLPIDTLELAPDTQSNTFGCRSAGMCQRPSPRRRRRSYLLNATCLSDSQSSLLTDETTALSQFVTEAELNLSSSNFTAVGAALSPSTVLRVLNLSGSTVSSEGLWGLADIPTLESVCVSHMRQLTSLVPLITPRNPMVHCRIQTIVAQCTPLEDAGIKGLGGLPLLRNLNLSMTKVRNVEALRSSLSLTELNLSVTPVTSEGIGGLERIPTLKILNLSRSCVTSVSSLAPSPSLETLLICSCTIFDEGIQGLEQMPLLHTLDVSTTKVSDLSILGSSKSLITLKARWLALKNVGDLIHQRRVNFLEKARGFAAVGSAVHSKDQEAGFAGLAEAPALQSLDLSFNVIRTVHSLCRSKSLKHLYLRRTRVDSSAMSGIQELRKTLETLEVSNLTDVMGFGDQELSGSATAGVLGEVAVVAKLKKLVRLDFSYTDVYDLRPLKVLTNLRELIIVETLVTIDGLRGIEEIPSLELLDLSQTSVLSLQFLVGGAPALKKVLVKSNRNRSGFRLGTVEVLPSLVSLDVSDTVIEDFHLLWRSTWALKELTWRWGERREATGRVRSLPCCVTAECFAGLGTMPALESIDLGNTAINTLEFLAGSQVLRRLLIDGCHLLGDKDMLTLKACAATLEVLDVSNNPQLTSLQPLSACRALRQLRMAASGVTAAGMEGVLQLPKLESVDIARSTVEEAILDEEEVASPLNPPCQVHAVDATAEARHEVRCLPRPTTRIYCPPPPPPRGSSAWNTTPRHSNRARPRRHADRPSAITDPSILAALLQQPAPAHLTSSAAARCTTAGTQATRPGCGARGTYQLRCRRRVTFLACDPTLPAGSVLQPWED